jgi:hypothetical protein
MDFHCKTVAHGDRFTLKTGPELPGQIYLKPCDDSELVSAGWRAPPDRVRTERSDETVHAVRRGASTAQTRYGKRSA